MWCAQCRQQVTADYRFMGEDARGWKESRYFCPWCKELLNINWELPKYACVIENR